MPEDALHPTRSVRIPLDEVVVRASRSSGPGGQHANVTASRIEASFDVAASEHLTDEQKRRGPGKGRPGGPRDLPGRALADPQPRARPAPPGGAPGRGAARAAPASRDQA